VSRLRGGFVLAGAAAGDRPILGASVTRLISFGFFVISSPVLNLRTVAFYVVPAAAAIAIKAVVVCEIPGIVLAAIVMVLCDARTTDSSALRRLFLKAARRGGRGQKRPKLTTERSRDSLINTATKLTSASPPPHDCT